MKIPADMQSGTIHNTKNNGDLRIIKYKNHAKVLVEFVESSYQTEAGAKEIRTGHVKDYLRPSSHGVGYLGIGRYVAHIKKIATPAYTAWHGMLRRCYSEKFQERNPAYEGCSVASVWHNFQTFAAWYHQHYPVDGNKYQLDKDIKTQGNKIYGPDTCVFVTQNENTLHASGPRMKTFHVTAPSGEEYSSDNQSEFCRIHGLSQSTFSLVVSGERKHHKGWRLTSEK